MAKVFLTGGSGFLASHILDVLLERGFTVTTTVRSEEKRRLILSTLPPAHHAKVSFAIVPDITQPGAFDEALLSHAPLDHIIHTATPYHFSITSPLTDIVLPAVLGTSNLLHAIPLHAPSVRRVILTSSSATILNPAEHAHVYDEYVHGRTSWSEALNPQTCYRAAKIYAERLAFAFFAAHPTISLTTINPPLLFGPPPRHLPSLRRLNTSNQRILTALQGGRPLGPTGPVYLFCDVRDAALAHVRALEVDDEGEESVKGKRFFVVGGYFSNEAIERVVRGEGEEEGDDGVGGEGKKYGFDSSRSREVLGINYRGLRECIEDTVEAMGHLIEE